MPRVIQSSKDRKGFLHVIHLRPHGQMQLSENEKRRMRKFCDLPGPGALWIIMIINDICGIGGLGYAEIVNKFFLSVDGERVT
jgi:hypothetical protein